MPKKSYIDHLGIPHYTWAWWTRDHRYIYRHENIMLDTYSWTPCARPIVSISPATLSMLVSAGFLSKIDCGSFGLRVWFDCAQIMVGIWRNFTCQCHCGVWPDRDRISIGLRSNFDRITVEIRSKIQSLAITVLAAKIQSDSDHKPIGIRSRSDNVDISYPAWLMHDTQYPIPLRPQQRRPDHASSWITIG